MSSRSIRRSPVLGVLEFERLSVAEDTPSIVAIGPQRRGVDTNLGKTVWYYFGGGFHLAQLEKVVTRDQVSVYKAQTKDSRSVYLVRTLEASRRTAQQGAWGFGDGGRARVRRNRFAAGPASGRAQRWPAGTTIQFRLQSTTDGNDVWAEGTVAEKRLTNSAALANPEYYNVYTKFDDSTHWVPLRDAERPSAWDLLDAEHPFAHRKVSCGQCAAVGEAESEDPTPTHRRPKYIADMERNSAVTHLATQIRQTPYFKLVQAEGPTGEYQDAVHGSDPVDPIKMFINMYLATSVAHFVPNPRQRAAVVLDAEYLLSAWTFSLLGGVPMDAITIPNGYYKGISWHSSAPEMQRWVKKCGLGVQVVENTSSELLGGLWPWKGSNTPTLFYLDYCGCFESYAGTEKAGMVDSLSILSHMPTDRTFLLGLTSCWRNCIDDVDLRMRTFIEDAAQDHGHTVFCEEIFKYHRKSNMVFEAFVFNAPPDLLESWTTKQTQCFPSDKCGADGDRDQQLHTSF